MAGGYFATDSSPTTFQFKFAAGVTRFGFHGTEAVVGDGSFGRDGVIDLQFYDMNDVLMTSMPVDTSGPFSCYDFYGFESDAGAIGRVVFQDVGHMVLDDVTFDQVAAANVPEPASIALFGLGLAGFAVTRRKSARK